MEKLINKLYFNANSQDSATASKIAFFYAVLFSFLLICIFLVAFLFIQQEIVNGIVGLIVVALTLANFFIFQTTKKIKFATYLQLFLIFGLILVGITQEKYIFFASGSFVALPFLAISMLSAKEGALWSLGALGILASIYFLQNHIEVELPINFIMGTMSMYIVVILTVYMLLRIRDLHTNQLEEKIELAQRQIKEKNDFIASLSYQIRTPLNNINGIIDFFSKSRLNSEQADLLNTLKASSNNLVSVVNNIGGFSNNKITIQEYEEYAFDLTETLNNTLKLYSLENFQKILFKTEYTDKLPKEFLGQPVKIKQILLNTIEFFVSHYPEELKQIELGLKIDLSREMEDKYTVGFEFSCDTPLNVKIDDLNNKNKSDENVDYIITRALIESNKGSLNIIINPFETLFSFTLELLKTKQAPKPSEDSNKPKTLRFKDKKIQNLSEAVVLIVEDNLINQKIMVLSLKKLVHEIAIANNGQEALDLMATTDFDIVLMDIQMPVMDGLEASMRIRKAEKNGQTQIPIVAITANALHGDRESCLAAGMNDYISKPFKLEVLLEKMKQHLKVLS